MSGVTGRDDNARSDGVGIGGLSIVMRWENDASSDGVGAVGGGCQE